MGPLSDIANTSKVNGLERSTSQSFSAAGPDGGTIITYKCGRCHAAKDFSQYSPVKRGRGKGQRNTCCRSCQHKRASKEAEKKAKSEAALPVIKLADFLRIVAEGASADDIEARIDTNTLIGQTRKEKADEISRHFLTHGDYRFK